MEFKSMRELLTFALSKEEAAVQFYHDLAGQMSDPITQSLFKTLSNTEKGHVQALQLELEKQGFTVDDSPEDPADADFQWDQRLEVDETAREMSFLDALVLAIQKERAAFRLYTQLLGTNQIPEFDKVLMELAEEEMRHVLQLEREYEAITHPKD